MSLTKPSKATALNGVELHSVWQHAGGALLQVIGFANCGIDALSNQPPSILYKLENGHVCSMTAKSWSYHMAPASNIERDRLAERLRIAECGQANVTALAYALGLLLVVAMAAVFWVSMTGGCHA